MFAPHSALSVGQAQLAPRYTQASLSRRMLTDRWGSDCWCLRTCSAMQLQLVIDSARSGYPERYSQESLAHGGQLVGSGRQSGPGCTLAASTVVDHVRHGHVTATQPQAHIVFTTGAFQPRLRRRRQTAHSRPCRPRGRDLLGGRQDGVFRRYAGTRTEITVSTP